MIQHPGSRILDPGSYIQDPGSGIQDPGSWIQDPGPRIQDPGSWIQDPGSRILDHGFWIHYLGSRMLDPGSWIQDLGSRILDPGSWIKDPGSRILDPGSRILDPWTLDPESRSKFPGKDHRICQKTRRRHMPFRNLVSDVLPTCDCFRSHSDMCALILLHLLSVRWPLPIGKLVLALFNDIPEVLPV